MKFYNALFLRIFGIIVLLFLGIFLLNNQLRYNSLLVAVFILLICIETYFYVRNTLSIYDKTILSILKNDFSVGLSEEYKEGNYKNLYHLYHTLREKQFEEISKEQIYQSILNNVDTGILILKKTDDGWAIFLMNDFFSNYFDVPKVSHWDYLKNFLPALCTEIENTQFTEIKTSVNIKTERKEMQTFMLQTSLTHSLNQDYFVVLLDSIQRVIEKKEKEAWVNLMKIISHELMNSLTPIRSLSQSLHEIVSQEKIDEDDLEDIRESLATIVNRSDHLQFFVENYRKLTMLPTPEKTTVNIRDLVKECLLIMSPVLKQENIEVTNTIAHAVVIAADKNQLEQVLINLITNSIHALKDKERKAIFVSEHRENSRLFLTITDTGKGIEKQIRDKVFLPFFTTRKDGAGIGLTLSKNIIEAHGGYLSYETDAESTKFVICLIDSP